MSAQAVVYGPSGTGGSYNAYQWITNDRTWDAARVDANGRFFMGQQGHLVTIGDAAENAFVNNIGIGTERWIGLTDSTATSTLDGFNAGSLGTTEGGNTSGQPLPPAGVEPVSGQRGFGFKWVDGTPYTYQSWNGGEPNNSGNENAAHYTGSAGLWNDNKAGTTLSNGADSNRDALVEYNTNIAAADLRAFKANIVKVQDVITSGVTVGSLTEARQVIAGTRALPAGTPQLLEPSFNGGNPLTQQVNTINFVNNAASAGFFAGDVQYPGLGAAPFTGDQNNFVIQATGGFTATSGGLYTFGVNSDDGFGLIIRDLANNVVNFQDYSGIQNAAGTDANQTFIVNGELRHHNGRGASATTTATNVGSYGRINLNAGQQYNFELVHWEGTGGVASLEAYWMLGTPTDYAANAQGTNLSFSDGAWTLLGAAGDLNPTAPFNVTTYKLFNQINYPDITSIAQADQVLAGTFGAPNQAGFPVTAYYSWLNINNAGSGNPTGAIGAFGANTDGSIEDPVFGLTNVDDFVLQATGFLHITQGGNYTFGVHSDDGLRLRIDANGDGVIDDLDNLINGNGVQNFVYVNKLLAEGIYEVELTWFERGGGAGLEFFSAFNPNLLAVGNGTNPLNVTNGLTFRLVGDFENGGLLVTANAPIPEPVTGLLGLVGLAALARRRNRAIA